MPSATVRGNRSSHVEPFVPIIDLSTGRDRSGREALATTIGKACEESGFLVVTGHGVDLALVRSMYDVTLEFFQLPEDEKDAVASSTGTQGFRRFGGYVAASSGIDTPPDLCQLFSMNRFGEPGIANGVDFGDQHDALTRPNVWPTQPSGFRDVWLSYFRSMEGLAQELMHLFALALGIEENFFDDKIDRHMTGLTANFYYPPGAPALPGQFRKGPHTDWGSLTILYQDDAGGLQVQDLGGEWTDVPFVPDSFVVNLGDLMAAWTSNRWVSTMHRVLSPPFPGSGRHRISIAFFHQPNYDAVIEPLEQDPVKGDDGEVITSGAWIAKKMAAAYGPRE